MDKDAPLDLRGIADMLQVGWWRVRKWRDKALRGGPETLHLPDPDVSALPRRPLWSRPLIESWAGSHGLWPPGVDQYQCPKCKGWFALYDNGTLRPHGWAEENNDGLLWECEGSGRAPSGQALAAAR